jgi:hypothetical protein
MRNRIIVLLLLGTLLITTLESCILFPNTSPSINGNIYQLDGKSNDEQIYVRCISTDKNTYIGYGGLRWRHVDATKSYVINNLSEGSYYVWAEEAGYSKNGLFSNDVSLVTVSKDVKHPHADLTLVQGGSISGQFVDQNGNPLTSTTSNVTVDLESDYIDHTNSIVVAANGSYSFYALMPGTYHIVISGLKETAAGFSTTFESFPDNIVKVASGKDTVLNLYLKLTKIQVGQ